MVGKISETAVVDANFVLSYLLPDEKSEEIDRVFSRLDKDELNLIGPPILDYEVINGLRTAAVRSRINHDQARQLAVRYLKFGIAIINVPIEKTLQTSLKHHLSAYDASYLVLAQTLDCPLLTRDEALAKLIKAKITG
jgi:predicted nucleic acid-binding protein